tara:strand:+ start:262 stop:621 length:360 start_codon:yes stop_codon:yes gene_type:complete
MFTILLSFHLVICAFLVFVVLLQRSEGGGLGIGQSGGIGDFMSSRGTANFLTKSTTVLAVCFFLSSLGLALIANKNFNKKSIIDSSEDSIIDRLDLIPEEFDVENEEIEINKKLDVPIE